MANRPVARAWQHHPVTLLLATAACLAPLYTISILSGLRSLVTGPAPLPPPAACAWAAVLATLTFGGWMVVLLNTVCGERVADLQLQPGSLAGDLRLAAPLTLLVLAVVAVFQAVASLGQTPQIPPANREIALGLAASPWALAAWLGPVVWLQAAVLEEGYRAFSLSRLWRVWPEPTGRVLVICGASLLFGIGHVYQGAVGMGGTALIGAVLGAHYLRHGRVLPLIIAHGLYDSLVLLTLVWCVKLGLI